MDCRYYTLLDILSSEQFRTVILLTAGLDTLIIADLLETNEWNVNNSLLQCLDQVGCRSVDGLAHKLLYEWDNDLYDHRLEKELAKLQTAARRMLERIASTDDDTSWKAERSLPQDGLIKRRNRSPRLAYCAVFNSLTPLWLGSAI